MVRTFRETGIVVIATLALGLIPGTAHAASVQVSGGRVLVTAAAGEVNDLVIIGEDSPEGDSFVVVRENGPTPLTFGTGCTASPVPNAPPQAFCLGVPPRVTASLGDRDDRVTNQLRSRVQAGGALVEAELIANLGTGNDLLDSLESFPSLPGNGARDQIEGGGGGDVMRLGGREDFANGGGGNDRIEGGGERDSISGGSEDDMIDGDLGDDSLRGDSGRDIIGPLRERPETIFCSQPGRPRSFPCGIRHFVDNPPDDGFDFVEGGSDGDLLSTSDGRADQRAQCGTGTDVVEIDLVDPRPLASAACETVGEGARDQHPLTQIRTGRARVSRAGRVRVNIQCAPRRRCAGRLTLRRGGRTLASRRYSFRAGRRASIALRLPASALRRAGRAGLVVRAVARERDSRGRPLTSTRRLRLLTR
jgi:hypothetical protein